MEHTNDFYNKVNILKKYWNTRNRTLLPARADGAGLKKQKILFFYNVFSKVNSKDYTFDNLKAFKDGPVYNDIYHYITSTNKFAEDIAIPSSLELSFNNDEFEVAKTLVSSLTSDQLSQITHNFNCWAKKFVIPTYGDFESNSILPGDFDQTDEQLAKSLFEYFSKIQNEYKLYKSKYNILAIKKDQYEDILANYKTIIDSINEKTNPVRIEVEDGGIVVDY